MTILKWCSLAQSSPNTATLAMSRGFFSFFLVLYFTYVSVHLLGPWMHLKVMQFGSNFPTPWYTCNAHFVSSLCGTSPMFQSISLSGGCILKCDAVWLTCFHTLPHVQCPRVFSPLLPCAVLQCFSPPPCPMMLMVHTCGAKKHVPISCAAICLQSAHHLVRQWKQSQLFDKLFTKHLFPLVTLSS